MAAMLARVDGPDGTFVGVHRTYLQRDGHGQWRRGDRASLGPIAAGAIRLAPAAKEMMTGEGIETCLAAMQATALPAWSALSTSGLAELVLPPCVHSIIILADHDRNGAGIPAAYAAAQRWISEGRSVKIALPPDPDTDFADLLVGAGYACIGEARNAA